MAPNIDDIVNEQSLMREENDPNPTAPCRCSGACRRRSLAGAVAPSEPELCVFGYGSLIWLPKFEYSERKVGRVKGFVRRFWQGNVTHRGTPDSPGRVATLVPDADGETWGTGYYLRGQEQIDAALGHLTSREVSKGGYEVRTADFYPGCDHHHHQAVLFFATPDNRHYMGEDRVERMARDVVRARGPSGHNLEYVFRLTDALRGEFPDAALDRHLAALEDACHRHLAALEDADDAYVAHCLRSRRRHICKHLRDDVTRRHPSCAVTSRDDDERAVAA